MEGEVTEVTAAAVSGVSLGAATAVCRVRQSRMKYAVSAISIWPGAHSRCTRLPTWVVRTVVLSVHEISISTVRSRYELTRDLCLALVISTATTHMVTKVPRVPNPQNTLASSCQHGVASHG